MKLEVPYPFERNTFSTATLNRKIRVSHHRQLNLHNNLSNVRPDLLHERFLNLHEYLHNAHFLRSPYQLKLLISIVLKVNHDLSISTTSTLLLLFVRLL